MNRPIAYTLLFVATMLLQVFLFDNLSLSVWVDPLVYVAFLILLPLDLSAVAILGLGLLTGAAMDFAMGTAGLNTLATLPVAFFRSWLLQLLSRRDDLREGGIPSPERLGRRVFVHYLIATVLFHHALFFAFEALSWSHIPLTALRTVASAAVTFVFVWLIARIFTAKVVLRP